MNDHLQGDSAGTAAWADIILTNSSLPYLERGPDELLQVPNSANPPIVTAEEVSTSAKFSPVEMAGRSQLGTST